VTEETEDVAIQHEYLTSADFARRAARAYTGFALLRPVTSIVFMIVAVAGVVSLVWGITSHDGFFTTIGIGYLAIPLLSAVLVYLRTLRGTARRVPVGSRLAIGLGTTALRIDGPLGSSTSSYRSYTRAYRRGDFVILHILGLRAYSIMPTELFPGDDFERLRSSIARANS